MVDSEKYATMSRDVIRTITVGPSKPGEPPSWWQGDDDATQSGLLAARQLGMNVDL